MKTVYTTMCKSKEVCQQLGQRNSVQTMDQQLYAIAQQVKWHKQEEMEDHVLRLGGFHTLSTFSAALGKLYADGGLKDILVNYNVYAPCTAGQMLVGKQFHRAIRAWADVGI